MYAFVFVRRLSTQGLGQTSLSNNKYCGPRRRSDETKVQSFWLRRSMERRILYVDILERGDSSLDGFREDRTGIYHVTSKWLLMLSVTSWSVF